MAGNFVLPETHKTEPELIFPFNSIFRERLRSESYIRWLFRLYGVRFDGIVNGDRHLKEVQRNNKTILPQKLPNRYRISLHIDDESIVCSMGRQYGYHTYQLEAQDDNWKEKIIARAVEIKRIDHPELING